jgi:hypothetical protein
MHILGGIGIAAVVVLAALFAFGSPIPPLPNEAQAAGYRFGSFFTVAVIPFLIAYPIAGRRKARNPNLFAGLFCGIAMSLILPNFARSLGAFQPETDDQKVSRLVREAAGLQPVRKSLFREDTVDTKSRDFFKQIIAINRDYQAEVDQLDTSATARLNTPRSFADPDSVAEGLRQLHAAYELDARQERRMSEVLENFRRGFDNLSYSDRESMLKGFNQGLAKVGPNRQRAVTTEKAWIDSLDDVYGYAQANHSQFSMAGGQLRVAKEEVRQGFNRRIHVLNAARQEFLKARSDFDRLQGETLQKTGINRGEIGLH